MRLSFKLPSWLLKRKVKHTAGLPRTEMTAGQAQLLGPPAVMWVGWPMDEDFNPNVLDAAHVDISEEALALLKTIPKSGDDLGDVDVFKTDKGSVVFAFLGGPLAAISAAQGATGSRTYDPALLRGVATVVPNNPPAAFVAYVDAL